MKVQGRYVLTTLAIIIMMVISTSYVFRQLQEQNSKNIISALNEHNATTLQTQLEQRGSQLLNYLSNAVYDPLYRYNLEQTYDILLPIIQLSEVLEVRVIDKEGLVFHDGTENLEAFGETVDAEIYETVLRQGQSWVRPTGSGLELAKPIRAGRETLGAVYVKMSLAKIEEDRVNTAKIIEALENRQSRESLRVLLTLDLVLILVALIAAMLISRSLVNPIKRLMEYANRVGEGDYKVDPSIKRNDEIGELAQSLNQMGAKLAERNKEITFLAYHDALTELPNRNRLISYLDAHIRAQPEAPFTLLFIDLDEFKNINDNLGHEAGDKLLQVIAKRFTSVLRPNRIDLDKPERECDIVSRLGGDEFLIYIGGTDKAEDINVIAHRLLKVIRKPVVLGEEELLVGGSIGAASYPSAGTESLELIKHADIAMYHAKAAGKNTLRIFTESLKLKVENKVRIEKELRRSMDDLSQFQLWYQPQIELKSGRLVGAEALIRWIHPERGLIPPIDFIEIAELTGLINPIGDWVIESVCRQLAEWHAVVPDDFHVALNLSARQMYRANLSEQFATQMARYKINPRQIHAEITETMLMIDQDEALRTLNEIKNKGVQIWLDDFGTGYSSLSYIRRYPVDGIKIDRSFVMNLEKDEQNRQLTSAILAMTDELNLPVVAEGIELEAHAELLNKLECEYGQGYLYSAPIKAEDFFQLYFASPGAVKKYQE